MADFCTLDGFPLDVAEGKWREQPQIVGSTTRTVGGSYAETRTSRKRRWTGATVPIVQATAVDIVSLIEGGGETWNFDSVSGFEYGSKGTGPKAGSTYSRSTTSVKFGAGNLYVAMTDYVEFDTSVGSEWAVFVWHRGNSGETSGATRAFVLTSTGDYWFNGTKSGGADNAANFISVTSGAVRLEGKNSDGTTTGTRVLYDDLLVLDFLPPDAMIDAMTNRSIAFDDRPHLKLDGDCIENGPVSVIGRVSNISSRVGVEDGAASIYNTISFVFDEV